MEKECCHSDFLLFGIKCKKCCKHLDDEIEILKKILKEKRENCEHYLIITNFHDESFNIGRCEKCGFEAFIKRNKK